MTFQYALRYTLDPRIIDRQKIQQLLDFCQRGQIDNVTFFINPEELNQSHLTAEQTDQWLNAIEPVSQKLATFGVTTSLNPWTTMMHSDRGQVVNPAIGFRTLVDYQGRQATSIACPGDPVWQQYLADRYQQYARIQPKELWLEDDFRHYNHTPLELGCFCDAHMANYCQRLGHTESRKEFVKRMLQPGEPTAERQIYLKTAQQEMITVAKKVEQAVHQVSPNTRLALMTSFPNWHAIEGRDWHTLLRALAGPDLPIVVRPHLPAYNEVSALQYSRDFEHYSRTTAALLGPDAILFPELENYMYSPFAKSLKFTQFQIETTALLGARGVLLNLFDMIGNGLDVDWHYAEMLAKIKPMLNALTNERLKLPTIAGIQTLLDQNSAQTIHTANGDNPEELLPRETSWAALLSTFGFSGRVTPVQKQLAFKQQTLAVSGQILRNFDNDQLTQLITDNFVLLDGEAVEVLLERGLQSLLHIKKAEWHPARTGYQSYEAFDGQIFSKIKDPRITMLQHTGDYLQIEYESAADVQVQSNAYRSDGTQLGPVETLIDRHIIVLPINYDPRHDWEAQYHDFRQKSLQQLLPQVDYLVGMPNVKLNVVRDHGIQLWISNFSLDEYDQIDWHPGQTCSFTKAKLVTASPSVQSVDDVQWQQEKDDYRFALKVPPLSTLMLQLS